MKTNDAPKFRKQCSRPTCRATYYGFAASRYCGSICRELARKERKNG